MMRLYDIGDFNDAEREARQLLALQPANVELLALLATTAQNRGDLPEAIDLWTRAAVAPTASPTHWNSLGRALAIARRIREAQAAFAHAAKLDPLYADALNNLGLTYHELGDLEHAAYYLREAIRVSPSSPVAYCNLGNLLRQCGRYTEAIGSFEQALAADPVNAVAANGLGITLQMLGDVPSAAHYYREALRVDPRYADASNNLATALKELGDFDAAIAQFRVTLKLVPHHPYTIYNLSQFAAEGRYQFEPEELATVKAQIAAGAGADIERSMLCFSVAAVHDAEQSHDEAFDYYRLANDLRKKLQPFDAAKHRDVVERVVKIFDADYFRETHGWGGPSQTPIFVVGMPRTGSTLVEQILATDPSVFAAGELGEIPQMMARLSEAAGEPDLYHRRLPLSDAATASAFAERYLAHLGKISKRSPHVTVKTLENFLHLGVIATLFPNAHVIHCVRDPLDVCVSCYFQNFVSLDFSWDFDDIASYYHSYERLAAHWQKTLPIQMHEVKYEDLIRNPERVTQNLFEHCGLEWRPRCLRYFENKFAVRTASTVQVRKPLSAKKIGRWQRYRSHLAPLFSALGHPVPERIPESCTLMPQPQADNIG